jgi:hypothetical protein
MAAINQATWMSDHKRKHRQIAVGVSLVWAGFFASDLGTAYASGGINGLVGQSGLLFVTLAVILLVWLWSWLVEAHQGCEVTQVPALAMLSPEAFEEWVFRRFRIVGFSVIRTGRLGEFGVDLVASKEGQRVVIHCASYRLPAVPEVIVRDLTRALDMYQARRVVIVTTGSLTPEATRWTVDEPIDVWDGAFLARWLSGQEPNPIGALIQPPSHEDRAASQPLEKVGIGRPVVNALATPLVGR